MDSLRFLWGAQTPPVVAATGRVQHQHHAAPAQVAAAVGSRAPPILPSVEAATTVPAQNSYMSPRPLRRIWPGGDGDLEMEMEMEMESGEATIAVEGGDTAPMAAEVRRRGNWLINIVRVGSLWKERGQRDGAEEEAEEENVGDRCSECGEGCDGCLAEGGEEVEEPVAVDRESFLKLLRDVSLEEAKLYAKMSDLSNLAYDIPKIMSANLLKDRGLRFVTSSLKKKADTLCSEEILAQEQVPEEKADAEESEKQRESGNIINASTAYQIAASDDFRSTNPVMRQGSPEGDSENNAQREIASSKMTSFMATTNSVTAVVAGKEDMKQAVAEDLNSSKSSPCEWFICDEVSSSTRYFVIQGSESLASWQANLLFEPIQFEGLDVHVHRGIYEAAKGIYQQMLPEIQNHLKSYGNSATLRFTGHSLGGSLALLVNLMLLIRRDAPSSSLLPVITFGAPSVMCGGDYLLEKLELPESHVQAITMHRDIVPRAFSCSYPDHVVKILTTMNGKFRNHPCLKNQKLLYSPMGKLLILQPEEKFSPHHDLLPAGSGLYHLDHSLADCNDSVKQLQAAQKKGIQKKKLQAAQHTFLNSPHPLEILSDRAAYGSYGTVYRDHDMNAYLRSVHAVHKELLERVNSDDETGRNHGLTNFSLHKFSLGELVHGGKETLKRFGTMVTSQNVHMIVVFLFRARALLLGSIFFVKFR